MADNNIVIPTFVKWAGGKKQLLKQLTPLFPKEIEFYIEPFLGGGAVFFYIKQVFNPKYTFLSDINKDLIETFKAVRDNPHELIRKLELRKQHHNLSYYYSLRKQNNNRGLDAASRFIYLNKFCYCGLWRVNSKGEFNVPIGRNGSPSIFSPDTISDASLLLENATLKTGDFRSISKIAQKGSFIYLDPPYMPLSKTAYFTSYTKQDFTLEDQVELSQLFTKLSKKGCKLMLTNSNTASIKELYSEFNFHTIKAHRFINCKGDQRGRIDELVITNY